MDLPHGLEHGGRGTWQLAVEYPSLFAAIIPICGRIPDVPGFFERLLALKDLPLWAFHGAKDERVAVENSKRIIAALRAHGGEACLTAHPDAGHDCWTRTYADCGLYSWLLNHRR